MKSKYSVKNQFMRNARVMDISDMSTFTILLSLN